MPGERRRAGRHFEAIRAAFRRAKMRPIGGAAGRGSAPARDGAPVSIAMALEAVPALTVDGLRALFTWLDRADSQRNDAPRDPAARFAAALALLARGGVPAGANRARDAAARELLDRALAEAGDPLGVLLASFDAGPAGLRVGLRFRESQRFFGADGAHLEIRFRGGPALAAPLAEGEANFPAGAALLESREIASMALDFPTFGRLRLAPARA